MSLTFSHLSADGFEEEARLKAGRKRSRIREAVSCSQCRTRKIRCDRADGFPCKQCRNRGCECSYKSHRPPSGAPKLPSPTPATTPTPGLAVDIPVPGETRPPTPSDSADSQGTSPSKFSAESTMLTGPPTKGQVFRGSERKTRMVGVTHWMTPCDDTYVLKAFLDRTPDFEDSLRGLTELKFQVRIYNVIPTSILSDGADGHGLFGLLPDRSTSEGYLEQFSRTYARVYNFLDVAELKVDLHRALDRSVASNPIHLLRTLLIIAISMQHVDSKRLIGRRIGQQVEHRIRSSYSYQKPCIGVMQLLLLLIILKTISSADTDPMYDLLGIQGLTSSIAFSMGLHRDPALFIGVSPYYAEVRKRLWACFFRLNLDFCLRSGTQMTMRLEDCDCPPPNDRSLAKIARSPETNETTTVMPCTSTDEADVDAAFNLAALRLAKLVAPVHQTLCSPKPRISADLQNELRTSLRLYLDTLPMHLRPGSSNDDPMQGLQQATISIMMHSALLIITTVSITSLPSSPSQQAQLLESWNYASSILYQFQTLTQTVDDVSSVAFHLLWTNACRAAFSACVIVGRLRNIDVARVIPVHPRQAVSVFAELLTKSLSSMLQTWHGRSHQGPVVIKTYILLAICEGVTSNLHSELVGCELKQELTRRAVSAAQQAIIDVKTALQQHQAQYLGAPPDASITLPDIHGTDADIFLLPDGGLNMDFSALGSCTDPWHVFDLTPDSIHLQDPLLSAFPEDPSMDLAF
ncbi:hypothetical protein F4780DRAFT_545122 [Xylariomycetidae sp. FL0641]|nr:hypothetical protein F4780DRAFT_545122 [Xylariomycetidae sp. FL0641]